ncbi:creatininase family protein [Aurantiacibacter gilvus]|uniref:Creatininase family protein n=1 Tax=Aurantiacibacter gilvus TaxID=3139141 RepID=A0ABU9IFX7_9SPHN
MKKPASLRLLLSVAVLSLVTVSSAGITPANAQDQTATADQSSSEAVPEMRTRIMTALTGWEVSEYLERNDVIFVPVGPVEQNGGAPVDVEYVIPLAYAQELAERADGLVLPHLTYFYPGGTTTSPATVYVSTSESLPYLKAITRSLIRQGFRRIIFLTSHGPSGNTMLPLVRETFDEYHVPVLWMDTGMVREHIPGEGPPRFGDGPPNARNLVTYGAYELVGRLEDMPVGLSQPEHPIERDPSNLSRYVPPFNGTPAGSFYSDPVLHGGFVRPVTEEEREEWGTEGAEYIRSLVDSFDVNGMLEELRRRDEYTRVLEERYGDLLPRFDR